MRRVGFWSAVPAALPLVLMSPLRAARAEGPDPAAFLAAAHGKHADLTARGLKSFEARVTLRHADDENVMKVRDWVRFLYRFTAPDQETFDWQETNLLVRKPIQDAIGGFWREATGVLWFPEFEAGTNLTIEESGALTVVRGVGTIAKEFTAAFEKEGPRLSNATLAADNATRSWTYAPSDEGWRVKSREASIAGSVVLTSVYEAPRPWSGFVLPTVLRLKANGKWTELKFEYVRVNGLPAVAGPPDVAAVKAAVEEMEKAWKSLGEENKVARMREVSLHEHDLASAAIARLGLKDSSPEVREKAAEILGTMKRENVVPALIAAAPANEKEIKVYLRIIATLGAIGDPRAVDILSKDWWNQRVPEHGVAAATAKIRALGEIRHASAVDALLDAFAIASGEKGWWARPVVVESLVKLTGQNFLFDRKAWEEWWKKNRATHKF